MSVSLKMTSAQHELSKMTSAQQELLKMTSAQQELLKMTSAHSAGLRDAEIHEPSLQVHTAAIQRKHLTMPACNYANRRRQHILHSYSHTASAPEFTPCALSVIDDLEFLSEVL